MLGVKTAEECRYDILSLGEVMLRLDPGDTTMASLAEVEKIVAGAGARVDR